MAADRLVRAAVPVETPVSGLTPAPDINDAAADVPRTAWQSAFVQDVVPFLTSLAVHATLVVLGVLAYRAIAVTSPPAMLAQAVIPDTDLTMSLPAGTTTYYFGPGTDPTRPAEQDVDPTVPPDVAGFSSDRGSALDLLADAGEGEADAVNPVIGLGKDGFTRGSKDSIGDGDNDATGAGRGGPRAPYGTPGGGIPTGSIFAGKRLVRSVAYVCDASGSMLDKFAPLREQLHRSVTGLKAIQSFNVIFFQEAQAAGLSKADLLRAVPENKRKADKFLEDVYPSGQTDPIPALELAFRQRPELIWLLTDGDFPDNAAVLAFIRRHNKDGRVRINTIAFVSRDEGYERVLKTIAAENGGEFRFVGERELE